MFNFNRKTAKQQKALSVEATNLVTSVYCMAVSQSIMDYLDGKIEELPDFVKSSMGA